jgi:hypothetical protein
MLIRPAIAAVPLTDRGCCHQHASDQVGPEITNRQSSNSKIASGSVVERSAVLVVDRS